MDRNSNISQRLNKKFLQLVRVFGILLAEEHVMQRLGYWQTGVGMVGLIVVGGWLAGCAKNQPVAGQNQPVGDLSLQLAEQATAAAEEGRIDEARETFAKAMLATGPVPVEATFGN